MYSKQLLDLEQARVAVLAVLDAAATGGGPVAVAVTDADGALVLFAAMDGVSAIPRRLAPRKARTAAVLGSDTTDLAGSGWAPALVAELGDGELVLLPGGAVARSVAGAVIGAVGVSGRSPGAVIGAVGVSGRSPGEDERLAGVGAAALSA